MISRRGLITAALLGGGAAVVVTHTAWWRAPSRALPRERSTPVLYVALGDSTVEGVGASRPEQNYVSHLGERLRAVYPTARIENLGTAGATSADVRTRQLARAIARRPDVVTLSVGPNDITGRVSLHHYAANVGAILESLAGQTRAVLVVNLIPDLAVTPHFRGRPEGELVGRLTAQFNDVLRHQAREHGAELVDLYEPSRAEIPGRPELVAADGYHPSDAGYARWAELVWPGIERRITR